METREMMQVNEFRKICGAKLKDIRIEHSLAVKEMCSILNVTHQQYRKYETGANQVSLDKWFIIFDNLQINPKEFMYDLFLIFLEKESYTIMSNPDDRLRLKACKQIKKIESNNVVYGLSTLLNTLENLERGRYED
jgi:transcriptional regulator with XRE-family HTH domain